MSLSGDDSNSKVGFTDANGMYSVHLKNIFAEIGGSFEKPNYYKTSGDFWYWKEWGDVPPANTNFIIVMRRIINPVPMTRKNITTHLPLNDEPVGFDLEVGDWVAPHGKGKTADFQMTGTLLRFETRNNSETRILMKFTDELCGIQSFIAPIINGLGKLRSQLMPPHTALDDGYEQALPLWCIIGRTYRAQTNIVKDRNYLFRTRVVVNDDGEIIKANYGWTIGDIEIDPNDGKKIWMRFSYYYNPDPLSKSLEPKEIADRQAKDLPKGEH